MPHNTPPFDLSTPLPSKRNRNLPPYLKDYEMQNEKKANNKLTKPSAKKKPKKIIVEPTEILKTVSFFKTNPVQNEIKKRHRKPINKNQLLIEQLNILNMESKNYIASELDQPQLVKVKSVNILKSINGSGLYARENIKANTVLGEYTGEKYSMEAFDKHLFSNHHMDGNYAVKIEAEKSIVDAKVKGNFTRYINFSDSQANAELKSIKKGKEYVVVVIAIESILAGQQILMNYNEYDEEVSKQYFFINRQDGSETTAEFFQQHKQRYVLSVCPHSISGLTLTAGCLLYVTPLGKAILENKPIDNSVEIKEPNEVNFHILQLNAKQEVLDATEIDLFTPLMAACYLGQVFNVNWLIKHGGDVNQQQHHSGRCALFFALEGYACAVDKDNFIQIIKCLLNNKANIFSHDREDKTFLHKAITVLSTAHFAEIVTQLAKHKHFDKLQNYLDSSNRDAILLCLANNKIKEAICLLSHWPDYFIVNCMQGEPEDCEEYKNMFKEAIQHWNAQQKASFMQKIASLGFNLSKQLVEELNLSPVTSATEEVKGNFCALF